MPENVKKEREEVLMTAQREIALEKNNSLIGSQKEVIIDTVNVDNSATGRTKADCPEIDQEVMVTGAALAVGQIVQVKIEAAEGYDLIGSPVRDKL
jgi:ribosomal protein S12 methylthiotransferase